MRGGVRAGYWRWTGTQRWFIQRLTVAMFSHRPFKFGDHFSPIFVLSCVLRSPPVR